jgi:hypothetical protein
LVANVAVSSEKSLPPEIVFDFSQLNFIRPAGVVFLRSIFQYLIGVPAFQPRFAKRCLNSQTLKL